MKAVLAILFLAVASGAQPLGSIGSRDTPLSEPERRSGRQLINLQIGGKIRPGHKPAIIDIHALTNPNKREA
jgi:hypothetical protein